MTERRREDGDVILHDNGIDMGLGDEFEGLSTCLIVANVPYSVFESTHADRNVFEETFSDFGKADFIYLKSFKRVLVNYESSLSAAMAKLTLHFTDFKEQELKVYFRKAMPESSGSLQPPKPEKQFLISPPASPPVGWEPLEEPIPVISYDLLSAVAALSHEPQELHAETHQTPSIIVHGCPNPEEDAIGDKDFHPLNVLPREIVQTSRPPLE